MNPDNPPRVLYSEGLFDLPSLYERYHRSLLVQTSKQIVSKGIYKKSPISVLNEKLWVNPKVLPYKDHRRKIDPQKKSGFEVCQVRPNELWIYYKDKTISFSVLEEQNSVTISSYLKDQLLSQTVCSENFTLSIISHKYENGTQYQCRLGFTHNPMAYDVFIREYNPATKEESKCGYKANYGETLDVEAFLF